MNKVVYKIVTLIACLLTLPMAFGAIQPASATEPSNLPTPQDYKFTSIGADGLGQSSSSDLEGSTNSSDSSVSELYAEHIGPGWTSPWATLKLDSSETEVLYEMIDVGKSYYQIGVAVCGLTGVLIGVQSPDPTEGAKKGGIFATLCASPAAVGAAVAEGGSRVLKLCDNDKGVDLHLTLGGVFWCSRP